MQTTARGPFAFADSRDLHPPHAGQPLSAESRALLGRLADCAERLRQLDLPQATQAPGGRPA